MRKLLVALSFFTRIKLNLKDVTEDDFYNAMILMPVVGLFIGAWIFLVAWAVSFIHLPAVGAVLVILAYLWITGGLHLDGVADTTDGLMSARDHDRVLEIMKDSRLGSFGAIALIILFLGSFAGYEAVIPLYPAVLVGAPVVGRFCGLQNCCFATYAAGGGGLGRRIVEQTKFWHIALYFVLIAVPAWAFLGWAAVIAFGCAIVFAALLLHTFNKGIGGMTGDTIGMTIELTQLVYVLAAAIIAVNLPELCVGALLS